MNKFDTIINVLEKVGLLFESHGQYPHTLREVNEALTAAKELKSLKPMSASQALSIVRDRAQWMRNEGESDMRSIIWYCKGLSEDINAGKSAEEIVEKYADGDEE